MLKLRREFYESRSHRRSVHSCQTPANQVAGAKVNQTLMKGADLSDATFRQAENF